MRNQSCIGLQPCHKGVGSSPKSLHRFKFSVSAHLGPNSALHLVSSDSGLDRLCVVIIVALPAATPTEFKNGASYALGGFANCEFFVLIIFLNSLNCIPVSQRMA